MFLTLVMEIHEGAAYTLLAKLYLNAEAWGVDSPRYKEAADACDVVMGLPYILEANWKTNFQVNNQQSREAILACCFSANDTEWQNQLHYRTLHYKDNIPLGATSAHGTVFAHSRIMYCYSTRKILAMKALS